MPELPEVQTVVDRVAPRAVGRVLTEFRSYWPRKVRPSAAAVARALRGARVVRVWRRAKYIVFDMERGGHLLVHLRMSGRLTWAADAPQRPRHVRARWRFADGQLLYFDDARKFGVIEYVATLAELNRSLGVEPLDNAFTIAALTGLLASRRRQLKPLLLDQRVIVGLGNIYADESLHRAGLHPLRTSNTLGHGEIAALRRAIRGVLREAIARNGTTIDWIYPDGQMQDHLRVYGRTGEPCRRCRTPIAAFRVGQRGTHICPRCQPAQSGAPPRTRFRKTGRSPAVHM